MEIKIKNGESEIVMKFESKAKMYEMHRQILRCISLDDYIPHITHSDYLGSVIIPRQFLKKSLIMIPSEEKYIKNPLL